ncbi:uroporphyrinogen-III C-methyltransferase [Bacillus sp. 03113]|uniref:uroporphyrinogen-III C-methyltransferase n=1 Tax=Bacillus sp. 03113 TaxID=2578211 RepID=UPI00114153D7|nr:uroporphyrinogen-III C-methyltransferase [Bacillus sp. 03113]
MEKGKVYIVGAGPGDPDLITVKATKCLASADVILYDRLVNPELLKYRNPQSELIYCGKAPGNHCFPQEAIHQLLIEKSLQGKSIARLKGGDPFVFGRGGEEAEALASHGIPFEIVPGITSGIAAPAYAGIPVTHRDYASSFAVVTGHRKNGEEDNIQWEYLAKGIDTIAIYMGVSNLPYIQEKLLFFGKNANTPVALIQWGTLSDQQICISTLGEVLEDIKDKNIENPCMILVGEVVKLREKIKWFEQSQKENYIHDNGVLI